MPLALEYAGCKRVWRERRCELNEPRALTIWVAGNTPPLVRSSGVVLSVEEPLLVGGGHRGRYVVPSEASEVTVERDGRSAVIALQPSSESPLLGRAQSLRSAGRWSEAQDLLEGHVDELTPVESMRARALLARLALARGEVAKAVPVLQQTAAAALHEGLLSEAAYDTLALAFVLTNKLHDLVQARAVLQRATADFVNLPEVQALLPYYKAVLAIQMGEQQAALLHLKEAILRAERLDLRSDVQAAQKQLALSLHSLGRHQEATQQQEGLMAESTETVPCLHLGNLITLTWFLLNSDLPVDRKKITSVLGRVERALLTCPEPAKRRNHALNLVYDALRQQQWDLARQRLDDLRAFEGGKDNRLITWEELFRGQLAASQSRWREALSHYLRSETLAVASGERALIHVAKLERARTLEKRGARSEALELLQEVEHLADELVRWVPLGEGQQMFALQLEGGTRSLVSAYLQRNEPGLAALAARRGRLRLLGAAWRASKVQALGGERRVAWEQAVSDYRSLKAALDQRAARDWELSKAELDAAVRERDVELQQLRNTLGRAHAALAPNAPSSPIVETTAKLARPTLLVTRNDEQWLALVGAGDEWQAFELGPVGEHSSSEQWGQALSSAFDHVAGLSTRCAPDCALGVIVHPLLEGLDVHALNHRGSPMLARMPIVYLLDDWTLPASRAPLERLNSTLIVGDPSGDLPVARREARAVADRTLATRQTLLLHADATKQAVLAEWRSSDLFHFSGHARFAGLDGLESSLMLAQNEQLTLADALTAEGSPRFAVLSACDAGRARTDSEGGLGMSHALIAAGSEVVVAPNRVVPDTSAARFANEFYATLQGYSIEDWATAARRASLSLRTADPNSDWSTYRVHAAR